MAIRFLLNQREISLSGLDPNTTVLRYLRETLGRCGTKEGCASGDCGACTVVTGEVRGGSLSYRAINACITLLPTLHGKQLLTVEDLAEAGELHPVQQAMVDLHGSQCGFCTPGIVMSLYALFLSGQAPDTDVIADSLAGNLCRCTGYRPIIAAARQALTSQRPAPNPAETRVLLEAILRAGPGELSNGNLTAFAPDDKAALAVYYQQHPDAHLFAGGTDLVLLITQQLQTLDTLVYLGNVPELHEITLTDEHCRLGACVPYSTLLDLLAAEFPAFARMIRRLGSLQIRNQGTVGGNLATASPIGDMSPVLIALDASVVLTRGNTSRTVPVADLFTGYRQTLLAPGEFIETVILPRANAHRSLHVFKISKRFDDDISSVLAACYVELDGPRVTFIRMAFGGMAPTPQRAHHCERVLFGQQLDDATIGAAMTALDDDFAPISDVRASAGYRRQVAKNLLQKLAQELTSPGQVAHVANLVAIPHD